MAESSAEELARRIAGYPREALSYFDGGFAAAATLTAETRQRILEAVIQSLKRGVRRLKGATLSPITKLSDRDSEQVASAYSVVIGLLGESSATPDEFVNAAKGTLFLEGHQEVAHAIAVSICELREEISATIARAQLAGRVLPSISNFEVVVDVRIRTVNGEVKTSIPVAIVHIDTDADRQELWMQLSQGEVEDLITTLNKCLAEMSVAEKAQFKA